MAERKRQHSFRTEFISKSAYLNEEFGLNLAKKKLGLTEQEIVEIVGRYIRGERKGQIKGKLCWLKVEAGGWISGLGVVKPCSFGYSLTDWEGNILFPKEYAQFQDHPEGEKMIFRDWILEQQKKQWDKFCEDHGFPIPENYEVYARYIVHHYPNEELLAKLIKEDKEFSEKILKNKKKSIWGDYFDVVEKILFCYQNILPDDVLQQFRQSESVLSEVDKDPQPNLKPLVDECRDRLINFILDKKLEIDISLFNPENTKRYAELQALKKSTSNKKHQNSFFDGIASLIDSLAEELEEME